LKFRALNSTQGTVVVPDVVRVDTAREPFAVVANHLKEIAQNGLWLNPYRVIPQSELIPDLDIVYLDRHYEVIRCIEGYRPGSMILPAIPARSALILPSGRASGARIHFGDQLELRDAVTGIRWAGDIDTPEDNAPPQGPAQSTNGHLDPESEPKGIRQLFGRLLGSKQSSNKADRRKAVRHVVPGLGAYFSMSSSRRSYEVKDISTEGFYVIIEDRWSPGTSLLVGLQILNPVSREVEAMISVQSKVVRLGSAGIGFTYDDEPAHQHAPLGVAKVEELVQLRKFLQMISK
jgi:hypothetical protein